jgi:phage-related minor tail protein
VNNTDNLEPYACPVCKSPVTAKDVFSPATLRKVVTGSDASASGSLSADAFGQQPAVRSSSKINAMMRILTELPKRQVSVSTETGEIVGDHKGGVAGEGSPEEGAGVYPVETTEKAIIFSQVRSAFQLKPIPLSNFAIPVLA